MVKNKNDSGGINQSRNHSAFQERRRLGSGIRALNHGICALMGAGAPVHRPLHVVCAITGSLEAPRRLDREYSFPEKAGDGLGGDWWP